MRKRNALNRGTAVYLGASLVRFVWPCGCTKEEIVSSPAGVLPPSSIRRLVSNWRTNGVTLEQCPKHPDWYSKQSQIERLNREHPQP